MTTIQQTDGNKVGLCIANTVILITSLIFSLEQAKSYSYFLFSIQLIVFYIYLYQRKQLVLFLTPIMLVITYVNVSFALGNYAFSHGIIAIPKNYRDFMGWKYTNYLTSYVLVQNMALFYVDVL
ncbi:MAG: hypothetical protein ACYSTF_09065, partial [Planctomycetota bacterium]